MAQEFMEFNGKKIKVKTIAGDRGSRVHWKSV